MLLESIFNVFYNAVYSIIDLIPVFGDLPSWIDNTLNVLSYGLMFFPSDVFITAIVSIVGWMTAHMLWALVEWVYKKIPGVD